MSADGNLTTSKNVHRAHTPEKTKTMSFVVPTLIDRNGVGSFSFLSTKPVTNYTPDPIFKGSYSQPLKPGSITLLPTILNIPHCTLPSFTNKCRSDGVSYLMAESAQSGCNFRMTTYTNRAFEPRRILECYGQHIS
jgi:hypothetical protein